MANQEIYWHLDPTVAERAVLGDAQAELWHTPSQDNPDVTSWAVFGPGSGPAVRQDVAATFALAKTAAEAELRRVAAEGR